MKFLISQDIIQINERVMPLDEIIESLKSEIKQLKEENKVLMQKTEFSIPIKDKESDMMIESEGHVDSSESEFFMIGVGDENAEMMKDLDDDAGSNNTKKIEIQKVNEIGKNNLAVYSGNFIDVNNGIHNAEGFAHVLPLDDGS